MMIEAETVESWDGYIRKGGGTSGIDGENEAEKLFELRTKLIAKLYFCISNISYR
jgi:hypothetical protein